MSPRSRPPSPSYVRARPGPDDLRRTFEAVPPRTSHGDEPFADTWWGRSWVAALESLSMDEGRLARGRTYADSGHVAAITVTPGRVVAYVQGSRARPYRAELRLRPSPTPAGTPSSTPWPPGPTISPRCSPRRCRTPSSTRRPRPAPGCCPPRTTSIRAAPVPTTAGPASTSPPSATRWPACWTPTRSSSCCCAAAVSANSSRSWAGAVRRTVPGNAPRLPPLLPCRRARPWPTASSRRCPPRSRYRHSPASHPRTRRCPAPAIRSPSTTSPRTRPLARTPS